MLKKLIILSVLVIFTFSFAVVCLAGGKEEKEAAPVTKGELEITPGTTINVFVDGGINVFPFELWY